VREHIVHAITPLIRTRTQRFPLARYYVLHSVEVLDPEGFDAASHSVQQRTDCGEGEQRVRLSSETSAFYLSCPTV
jgi:hypothetical protein